MGGWRGWRIGNSGSGVETGEAEGRGGWGAVTSPGMRSVFLLVCLCSCQVPKKISITLSTHRRQCNPHVRTIAIVASIVSVVGILIDSSLDVSICISTTCVRTYVPASSTPASLSPPRTVCVVVIITFHLYVRMLVPQGLPSVRELTFTYVRTYPAVRALPYHIADVGLGSGQASPTARRAGGQSLGVQGWCMGPPVVPHFSAGHACRLRAPRVRRSRDFRPRLAGCQH